MDLSLDSKGLGVFKALACQTRIDIINLIAKQPMNQREIAEHLKISPAIISGHIRQLESAGIVKISGGEKGSGRQHICYLAVTNIQISLADEIRSGSFQYSIPVGLYSKHKVAPTCGLVSSNHIIGSFDDPLAFLEAERTEAQLLWLGQGYVEYIVPNKESHRKMYKITVSLELASEHPGSKLNWPSEISFFINNVRLGSWISPGNYADRRGKITPVWWSSSMSQYGLLKTLTVDGNGTYIDEEKISDVTIDDLNPGNNRIYLRIAVEKDADPVGGLTIFGREFGDHRQDILVTCYFESC